MTFADLNAPFPLFEAPITDADDYRGQGVCSVCKKASQVCFDLGIGCAFICRCESCGTENGMDASDRKDVSCRRCGQAIPFPSVSGLIVCYSCLRAGKAAITKMTELGMISWKQAFEGITHGRPGLSHPDFQLVPTDSLDPRDSDWVRARLPQDAMFELLRTPTYTTIQGESWQFCCRLPMVFVGQCSRAQFTARAPDGDGEAFFRRVVQDVVPGLWEDKLHDVTGVYVFRCQKCQRLTAHWDLA
jgi:uncharacterized protein CbrC (UPF0167 family)